MKQGSLERKAPSDFSRLCPAAGGGSGSGRRPFPPGPAGVLTWDTRAQGPAAPSRPPGPPVLGLGPAPPLGPDWVPWAQKQGEVWQEGPRGTEGLRGLRRLSSIHGNDRAGFTGSCRGYTYPAQHGAAWSRGLEESGVPRCPGTEARPYNLVLPPEGGGKPKSALWRLPCLPSVFSWGRRRRGWPLLLGVL